MSSNMSNNSNSSHISTQNTAALARRANGKPDFSGIWVALITPFTDSADAAIDFPALQTLAKKLIADGATGLVVCGSTGEAAALSSDEQLQVLDAVLAVVPARQVIMGLSGNHMQNVLDRLALTGQRQVAGVLVTAPYYIRPSQAGVLHYFQTIANASAVPVLLYNIPYRTGVNMELPTLRELARHDNIVAIKDCGGNLHATMQLIIDDEIQVLAGEDHQVFSTLCLGGTGAILASAHLRPDLFARMHKLISEGQLDQARSIFYHLLPVMQALFEEPNPAPLKAVLASIYPMQANLRAPMQNASIAMNEKILQAYACLQDVP
ncbi:4-hydroxy-tetrahydrodipicolinate synthase [Undibacterium sp. TS12]|uniref:4-hydroxy-tetrahydrodipicolinate synthase n=1 Tax=Undibacterium sp. TS12 TaxID=2908202 RepID=UPI001F4CB211|nr:4-hydroxy-tetrahydrodipicolinate synthase [Undibacterium sp. TS12]MCH8619665.1 4-hydroxy-tetrahydrodipicolinate synthase [Undibacterium sp. TS12]